MFRITEGQYVLGGLTVLAAWLFVILPLLHYFGTSNATEWVTLASTIVTAIAGGVVALFTIVLARVGNQQIADTRILQRAYVSVEPQGVEWLGLEKAFIGHIVFKNVGKLPATEFVSVVMKIEVQNAEWGTPILTDDAAGRGCDPLWVVASSEAFNQCTQNIDQNHPGFAVIRWFRTITDCTGNLANDDPGAASAVAGGIGVIVALAVLVVYWRQADIMELQSKTMELQSKTMELQANIMERQENLQRAWVIAGMGYNHHRVWAITIIMQSIPLLAF